MAVTIPVCLCKHFSSSGRFLDQNGVEWGRGVGGSTECLHRKWAPAISSLTSAQPQYRIKVIYPRTFK